MRSYNFEFERTENRIRDDKTQYGEFDIMCWNYDKNECGTIYGSGINWKNRTIDRSRIGFLNTSPLKKGNRSDYLVLEDFLKALSQWDSSEFTSVITFRIF